MPATTITESAQQRLDSTRKELHEYCVVCSERHPLGLHARFVQRVSESLHRMEGAKA